MMSVCVARDSVQCVLLYCGCYIKSDVIRQLSCVLTTVGVTVVDKYFSEKNHYELISVTINILYLSKMLSCDDELEAECDDKGKENIKIENLRILKTIGTGGRSICNVYTGCPKKKGY